MKLPGRLTSLRGSTAGRSSRLAGFGYGKQLETEKKTTVSRLQGLSGTAGSRIPDVQSMFRFGSCYCACVPKLRKTRLRQNPSYFDIFGPIQIVLREPEEGPREVWTQIETARALDYAIGPLIYVVAGAGFEPTTFGL